MAKKGKKQTASAAAKGGASESTALQGVRALVAEVRSLRREVTRLRSANARLSKKAKPAGAKKTAPRTKPAATAARTRSRSRAR